jgi:glycosyltransferase involved in cell wall biosynthesis
MNVIHVVISLAPGGLERLVVDWTNARNHQQPGSTRICCLDEPGTLAGQVAGGSEPGGVVVCVNAHRARWPFDLAAVRRIKNELLSCWVVKLLSERPAAFLLSSTTQQHNNLTTGNRLQPVVLHAHNLAAWQYAVLAKISQKPFRLIYTQHGANVHNLSLRDRVRARLLACFTDEIVAVSNATAEAMSAKLWIPRKRIRVIANGVRTPHLNPLPQGERKEGNQLHPRHLHPLPSRERAGVRGDLVVIGSVGRLAHIKGYDRLITAFAALKPQGLSCPADKGTSESQTTPTPSTTKQLNNLTTSLLLVGDGPERGALERQAQQLGVADRVTFTGYQANPAPYLTRMDLFVLPSRSEGMSVALLEAMAAGIPVAVTKAGANREIIDGGHCGTLLADDEGTWAHIMAATLDDQGTTTAKVHAARQRVRDHYSLQTTLAGYERLYAGLEMEPAC